MKASDLPLFYNSAAILEHNLERRAGKVALFTPDRELTFRQVAEEVNRFGNALKSLDVRLGEYVGILVPDCAEWAVSYFAIMKIGAIAVGMNTMLKPLEHLYVLRDCRARVLIVHHSLLASVQGIREQLDFVANIIVVGGSGEEGDLEYRSVVAAGGVQLASAPTQDRKSTRLNSSHTDSSRMPSSA